MRLKPTYTVHDLNRLKTNFKCKQVKKKCNFSATFRHFNFIGSFWYLSANLWLSLASNGS